MDDSTPIENTEISIEGMSCAQCIARVEAALRGIPGVETVEVTIGHACVEYQSAFASRVEIGRRIERLGYRITATDGLRKGRIAGWLDRMARSNKETFGEGTLSCCTLGRKQAPRGK